MKARIKNGKIVKYAEVPKTHNGINGHYINFRTADESILETEGFFDVVVPSYDPVTEVIYNLHLDESYPAPTPDDANATRTVFTYDVKDKVISKTLDELKTDKKNELNKYAFDKLQPTDWMVIRNAEKGTVIDSAIQTERDDIRSAVTIRETEIDNLTTKEAVLKYNVSF